MIIFATVFGVGFAILIISLIFGGHGDVHVDIGHDAHFGSGEGPSIFSFRIIALLMVGFGAVGFGCRATTDMSMFKASLVGIVGALGVSVIGYLILRMFYANQGTLVVSDSQILGQQGNVIDAIADNGLGQIACVIAGREITFLARSEDNHPIAKNALVRITGKSGNIVTVAPAGSRIIQK